MRLDLHFETPKSFCLKLNLKQKDDVAKGLPSREAREATADHRAGRLKKKVIRSSITGFLRKEGIRVTQEELDVFSAGKKRVTPIR